MTAPLCHKKNKTMAKFQIQKASSHVNWTGKKVLGLHTGTIKIASGIIEMDDDEFKESEVAIDMTSIVVTDIDDRKTHQEFKDHLFHDDFFAVNKHPTSHLIVANATRLNKHEYKLDGTLTIKNITHPITFTARVERFSDTLHSLGEIVIDRTLYNIRYGSGKFIEGLGDKLIYDEFVLQFKLIAQKEN
jgi:polyisoprenoid-binding protein YceI